MGRLRALGGILRSLIIYWRPGRQRGLRALYRPFVAPGDLVFDVGAHLGDRTRAFADLGARVVAVEPQPRLVPWLRWLVGRRPQVSVLATALGDAEGEAVLRVSPTNPTVASASAGWREAMSRHPGFRGVVWEEEVRVPVTTLDRLIERHGPPAFLKIDVEGFEARVLAGLTQPVPALSLEFIGAVPGPTLEALAELARLGPYRFNVVGGEGRRFHFPAWVQADALAAWLEAGADGFITGDLYAVRERGEPGGSASNATAPVATAPRATGGEGSAPRPGAP